MEGSRAKEQHLLAVNLFEELGVGLHFVWSDSLMGNTGITLGVSLRPQIIAH
jgi:hypothetical protein